MHVPIQGNSRHTPLHVITAGTRGVELRGLTAKESPGITSGIVGNHVKSGQEEHGNTSRPQKQHDSLAHYTSLDTWDVSQTHRVFKSPFQQIVTIIKTWVTSKVELVQTGLGGGLVQRSKSFCLPYLFQAGN